MGARLEGKAALVTGATSNIGRAIALAFGAQGAHVVVSGRNVERGAMVIGQIRAAGGRADFIGASLDGSAQASKDLATEATRVLGGRIDIVVYAVNVKAPYVLPGAIAPVMAEAGQGAIINLGSWIARLGIASALYSSTKGAIETLTRAWARCRTRRDWECG